MLGLTAVVGVVATAIAWGCLELVFDMQKTHLPHREPLQAPSLGWRRGTDVRVLAPGERAVLDRRSGREARS